MPLLSSELALVVRELSVGLRGAVVQKVFLPRPELCFLEVRQVGRSVLLCLSAEAEGGRLSVAGDRPPSPPRALALQQRLRKLLTGAKLESIVSVVGSRTVWIDFMGAAGLWRLSGGFGGGKERLALIQVRDAAPSEPSELPASAHSTAPPVAPRFSPRFTPIEGALFPWAEAAERWGRASETVVRTDLVRRQKEGRLRTQLKRLRRTIEKVRDEASRAPLAEQHRRFGELISYNVAKIPRGARSVRLTEYGLEGQREIEVPLHPERGPREEAEWNFKQYRRLQRGVGFASERLRILEGEAAELERELQASESQEIALPLPDRAVVPMSSPTTRRPAVAKPYKEYVCAHQGRIWVGKGGADNDRLTFEIARPNDPWLHVRGVPGAHVVISWGKAAAPPQELLLDAAHLAAHYSAAKGEPRIEVSHTRAKYVRRVKGGAPGSVSYTGEKTFLLRIEPERLERLLRSR